MRATWEACSGNLEFWEPSQHLLLGTEKPRKTCVEMAGRRTFRILTSSQQSGMARSQYSVSHTTSQPKWPWCLTWTTYNSWRTEGQIWQAHNRISAWWWQHLLFNPTGSQLHDTRTKPQPSFLFIRVQSMMGSNNSVKTDGRRYKYLYTEVDFM